MQPREEETLVHAAAAGDARAFETIYQAHAQRLHGYALRRLRDPGEAEDLVQEVFLALARAGASFRARPSLAAFLFGVARNRVRNRRRDRRELVELPDLAAPSAEPEKALALREALARIPAEQREALLLAAAEGLSYEEIAAAMGCAVGTVRSRIARARLAVHAILEGSGK